VEDRHHPGAGEAHAPEHRIERLVFFSDAVFAIAITLLVIELHPPHLAPGADAATHLAALTRLFPEFIGFVTSFFVIGAFWAGHHRTFALARDWHERLVPANLFLLFAIAAMPFVSGYMSANSAARLPVLLYVGWLLVASAFSIRLQRLVTTPPVVDPTSEPARIALLRHRGLAVPLGAACALVAVSLAPLPGLGLLALLSIPLWRRLLDRRTGAAIPKDAATG
jgi:uncharacterized membrane protein